MTSRLALIVLATFPAFVVNASAALTCPDRTPAAVASVAAGSLKCQAAIASAAALFLKAKIGALAKCKVKNPVNTCPTATDTIKIETAANKAAALIAKKCADDAAQGGLASTYGAGTDDTVVSSCVLSQDNVVANLISAETHGPTTEAWPSTGAERAACVRALSKAGTQFLDKAHKNATKCLGVQMKHAVAGDLAPICVGAISGGVFVPPTDAKAAAAQAKLVAKSAAYIAAKCGPAETLGQIATMFACPGAQSVADLQQCVACGGWTGTFEAVENEYSERGTYVANGPGALQAAVTAAAPGQKLLLGSGDYQEEVRVATDGISIVGCGGATNVRPRILPPGTQVFGRGIRAFDVDGTAFQSLEVFGWQNDGIFVSGANGVTFRDIIGDGNNVSRYAVFPVRSNNVTIELCTVRRVADAGIYVGQSSTILVRYNDVRDSVAGTEFENCGNATGYGNYATQNTGGMLVFLDGSLPVQVSDCNNVHHNLFENNNTPNFGVGTVAGVPTGTGLLIISNDTSPFSYNISRGNDTFGIALVDEVAASFFVSPVDPILEQNYIFNNVITGNGLHPDLVRSPLGGDLLGLALDPAGQFGTCMSDNVVSTPPILIMPFGDPVTTTGCAAVPAFPSCPAPSVTSSTTSTTTTSTTSTTLSSPSGAFVD